MGARSSIYSEYGCCVQPDDEMEKRRGTSHVMIQVGGSASLLPLLGLPPTLRQNRFSFHYYSRATLAFVMTAFPIAEFSMLLLLAAGFYLALSAWSLGTSWIAVTLVSLLLMIALGAGLIGPRIRAIGLATRESSDGLLPSQLSARIHDPVLFTVLLIQAVLLLSIIFLMTTKPELVSSIIVMGVALVVGLAWGVLVSRSRRSRGLERAAHTDRTREPVA